MGIKHYERPSLVIMLCTFNVNWSDREWNEYEASIQTRYINIRTSLAGRNTKLLLVAVKVGTDAGGVDQEKLIERKSSLTSALQLDNYNFDPIFKRELELLALLHLCIFFMFLLFSIFLQFA